MPATTTSHFEALAAVHPHHAARLALASAALVPGTIVTVLRGTEGAFYTGLHVGDRAVVTDSSFDSRVAIGRLDGEGAYLITEPGNVEAVPVETLTVEEAKVGEKAAARHARDLLEQAYASANGLLGARPGEGAAIEALREAKRVRDYGFALGVLASRI